MVLHTFNSSIHKAETNWSLWVEASLLYIGSSGTVRAVGHNTKTVSKKKRQRENWKWSDRVSSQSLHLTYFSQVSTTSASMKSTTGGSNAWTHWHLSFSTHICCLPLHRSKAATLTAVQSKPCDHRWLHVIIVDSCVSYRSEKWDIALRFWQLVIPSLFFSYVLLMKFWACP